MLVSKTARKRYGTLNITVGEGGLASWMNFDNCCTWLHLKSKPEAHATVQDSKAERKSDAVRECFNSDAFKNCAYKELDKYTDWFIDWIVWNIFDFVWLKFLRNMTTHEHTLTPVAVFNNSCQLFRIAIELSNAIATHVSSPFVKNVSVLLKSSAFCRRLCGTVGILCKSGKDRTSMGVSLEHVRYLCEKFPIEDGTEAVRLLRKYGVRRMNVYANTGQSKYSFNRFQCLMLPDCYRPPQNTFSGSVATWIHSSTDRQMCVIKPSSLLL